MKRTPSMVMVNGRAEHKGSRRQSGSSPDGGGEKHADTERFWKKVRSVGKPFGSKSAEHFDDSMFPFEFVDKKMGNAKIMGKSFKD